MSKKRKLYELHLSIRGLPKLLNRSLGKHYMEINKDRKFWKRLIFLSTRGKLPREPLKKFTFKFTRFSSSEPDYDGVVGSFKAISDGLVEAGIVKDDKFSMSGPWEVSWRKAPRKGGYIEISVFEVEV